MNWTRVEAIQQCNRWIRWSRIARLNGDLGKAAFWLTAAAALRAVALQGLLD